MDLFPKVEVEKMGKLPFVKSTHTLYFMTTTNVAKCGTIYKLKEGSLDKAQALVTGKSKHIFTKGDKVYTLPGCKVPGFKVKEFLRTLEATITGDISKATVVIGNKNLMQRNYGGEALLLGNKSLIFKTTVQITPISEHVIGEDTESMQSYDRDRTVMMTMPYARQLTYEHRNDKMSEIAEFMTPYAANVIYYILSKKLEVVNEEDLLLQLPTTTKLDREMYDRLVVMFSSTDEEDRKIAAELLANSDFSEGELYVYLLSKDYYWEIERSRYKNIGLFVEKSGWNQVYRKDEDDYLKEHLVAGTLTKEHLHYLLPEVHKNVSDRIKDYLGDFFVVELKPTPAITLILEDELEKFVSIIDNQKPILEENE